MSNEETTGQKELSMLRNAIETSISPMMFAEFHSDARRSGVITYVNRAVLDLYKFDSKDEIVGKPLHVHAPQDIQYPKA